MASGAHDTILTAGALQLRFSRRDDRFHHAISLLDKGRETMLLESVEGTHVEHWPPSPPLQSLHQERRPDGGKVALLVGMAGSSHWSAAIELCPSAGITCDLACRIRSQPDSLGSVYRLGSNIVWDRATSSLTAGAARCRVNCHANGASAAQTTTPAAGLLALQPIWPQSSLPATVRWRYALTLD